MEFAYEGGGLAKGGAVTLFHDGSAVGEGRVEMTQPMVFSADETTDVGRETRVRTHIYRALRWKSMRRAAQSSGCVAWGRWPAPG